MRTGLHTARSGGTDLRDLEKPLMAKHNGNDHVDALRPPHFGYPWRRSGLSTAPGRCHSYAAAVGCLPHPRASPSSPASPFRHRSWDYFFPFDKAHTDGALSATIKGLRWVMGNGRIWHVLVCLSAIFP